MTIDTREYAKELEDAGVSREQARAHARALKMAVNSGLATKHDLDATAFALRDELQKLRARVDLITWMLGFNLAATTAVLWKLLR